MKWLWSKLKKKRSANHYYRPHSHLIPGNPRNGPKVPVWRLSVFCTATFGPRSKVTRKKIQRYEKNFEGMKLFYKGMKILFLGIKQIQRYEKNSKDLKKNFKGIKLVYKSMKNSFLGMKKGWLFKISVFTP